MHSACHPRTPPHRPDSLRTLPECGATAFPWCPPIGARNSRQQLYPAAHVLGTPEAKSMNTTPKASFDDASRADARSCAQDGLAALARAFNHCGRPELAYRYTSEVQSRFEALAVEMVRLIECGEVEHNPSYRGHLLAMAARTDKTLQTVIRKASRKTVIRGK